MRHLLAATVLAAAALPAAAQFQKPEDAIKYRQSAFTLIGNHFGRLGAMAQGKMAFDARLAASDAALVTTLAGLPWAAFGPGTDKGAPTRAKPEVWSNAAGFKTAAEKFQAELAKLDAAARTGDEGAIKSAVGGVGGACKGCHDDFRNRQYSN